MPERQFLFVNSENPLKGEHKISTTGRAFVIRKARAEHGWSTKSKNKSKVTKQRQSRDGIPAGGRKPARNPAHLEPDLQPAGLLYEHGRDTGFRDPTVAEDGYRYDCRVQLHPTPSDECHGCLLSHEGSVCPGGAGTPVPRPQLGSGLDPFKAMSLNLSGLDTSLLAYCKSVQVYESTIRPQNSALCAS